MSSRERTLSKFLFYKYFYASPYVTVLCEGETDNIYLKSAIDNLKSEFPGFYTKNKDTDKAELKIRFLNYTKRTRFIMGLYGGGNYLRNFVRDYGVHYKEYKADTSVNPVVLILDNDSGPNNLIGLLKAGNFKHLPDDNEGFRGAKVFFNLVENLYLILVPGEGREIEDLFTRKDLGRKVSNKTFNYKSKALGVNEYGKVVFANKVVAPHRNDIDFSGFMPVLNQVKKIMEHHSNK